MRRLLIWVIVPLVFVAMVIVAFGYWVSSGLNKAANLEPGVVILQMPSGAVAYLHRQAYFGKPAEVYISANGEICAPYDEAHDYRLPRAIQGGAESPVLISYTGNIIVVHGPGQLRAPSRRPGGFNVAFQQVTPEAYASYVGVTRGAVELPKGWIRVAIPFGHNTCSL